MMVHDLRRKGRLHMPIIPESSVLRERLDEVLKEAAKLEVLLRVALDMDGIEEASLKRP